MRWSGRIRLIALAFTFAVAACSPTLDSRGFVANEDALASLEPGQNSRTDVSQALGTPSTQGTFGNDTWYYMSERTETVAFLRPKVIERKIIAITFDQADLIEDIFIYTEADGQPVKLVSRVTPTAGNEFTLIQQIFGNLGRFNN